MPQKPLTKHDIAISFFKLVAFQSNFNWNNGLLLRTAYSLEAILNSKAGDPILIPSSVFVLNISRKPFDPEVFGPLNLLTSSTDDPFGIIKTINKRKFKSRFCEKLTYGDFELFIFVENRKLVSLIIDPHQFLNVFYAKKIAKEMNTIDLENLGIGWSSKDSRGKVLITVFYLEALICIDWANKDSRSKVLTVVFYLQALICICWYSKEYYQQINLSHHLLFKTINELWESHSVIDTKEEFIFDLLPSLIILYDFSGFGIPATYLDSFKALSGRGLFKKNRFCLKTGTYLPNYGLFKSKTDYKDFNAGDAKCPLSRKLTIQVASKNSKGNVLNGDYINRAKTQLLEQKAELILSNFVRKQCLSKYKNKGKNSASIGYFPENDEHVKKLFELHQKNRKLNTGLLFELCRSGVLLHLNFSENNYGFDLVCITINPDAFQSFLREKLYKQKNKTPPPSIQPANLLFCSEWYLENLDEYIFAVNEELNKPEHEKTIKLFAKEFPDIGRIYNRQELTGSRLIFCNYKKATSKDSPAYEPIFYDIGKDDGPNGNKNKFLENDSLAKY